MDAAYADGFVGCPALDDTTVAVDALVAVGVFGIAVAALDEVAGVNEAADITIAWLLTAAVTVVTAIAISAAAA